MFFSLPILFFNYFLGFSECKFKDYFSLTQIFLTFTKFFPSATPTRTPFPAKKM